MANPQNQETAPSVQFLLAEYGESFEEFRRLKAEGLNRLNFFVAITSSVLAGLVFLGQIGQLTNYLFQLISISTLLFLIILGWDLLEGIITRDINTDANIRAIGRIRRFFADQDPSIKKYLMWQDHDEPTKWITSNESGIRRTSQSILSLLCGLAVGLIANVTLNILLISIFVGVVGFIIAVVVLRNHASRRFKEATETASRSIRFPQSINRQL